MANPVVMFERAPTVPSRPDFETVYAMYVEFVWRCLSNFGVAPHALEDAAQEVFVVVHRRLDDFRDESSLRTWLFGIARHVASNYRRSHKRQRSEPLPEDLELLPSSAPGPHELVAGRESANFVQAFLGGIDASRRDVFMLVMLEEIGVPEVAEMLSIPVNTAYTRLRRARLEFQRALRRRRLTP